MLEPRFKSSEDAFYRNRDSGVFDAVSPVDKNCAFRFSESETLVAPSPGGYGSLGSKRGPQVIPRTKPVRKFPPGSSAPFRTEFESGYGSLNRRRWDGDGDTGKTVFWAPSEITFLKSWNFPPFFFFCLFLPSRAERGIRLYT